MVQRDSAPIDVKTGSSDPEDFALTGIPINIFFVAYRSKEIALAVESIGLRVVTTSAGSENPVWAVALIRPIFKQKKGFVNLCLGQNYYCSMGSS
jgi:hypothetical protein